MITFEPIKTIQDNRLNYLIELNNSYKELGYSTRLDIRLKTLQVFDKGYIVPLLREEAIIEQWID